MKEALSDADWINSMQEELHQFEEARYGTWFLYLQAEQ